MIVPYLFGQPQDLRLQRTLIDSTQMLYNINTDEQGQI